MERSIYLHALKYDSEAFAVAAEQDLTVPVAACPGWDVGHLVHHLIGVHQFWRSVVEQQLQDPRQAPPEPAIEWGALVPTFRHGAHLLHEVLEAADPTTRVWTWAPQQDVAFVVRRMAQETAVHRWDAQAAQAAPTPIEPVLAADGVDEFVTFMAPVSQGVRRPIRLECTGAHADAATATLFTLFADLGEPVATVRSDASQVLLALWRRVPLSELEVTGDAALAQQVIDAVGLD